MDEREEAGVGNVQSVSVTIGSVLGRTIEVLRRNPGLFFGLSAIAAIPPLLVRLISVQATHQSSGANLLLGLLNNVVMYVFQGAMAYGVYQLMVGRSVYMADALSRGLSRIVSLIGASILIGLGVGLGSLLVLVPGLILACMWYVAIPVCVVERLGAVASMSRSSELTKGYRWTIFGLFVLMVLLGLVVNLFFGFIGALASGSPVVALILASLVGIIPQAIGGIIPPIMYYELRAVKEGVTADYLANVFD